jgi:hypothetical protein
VTDGKSHCQWRKRKRPPATHEELKQVRIGSGRSSGSYQAKFSSRATCFNAGDLLLGHGGIKNFFQILFPRAVYLLILHKPERFPSIPRWPGGFIYQFDTN